jgi:hypothetical protein
LEGKMGKGIYGPTEVDIPAVLPWKVVIEIKADSFDLIRHYAKELGARVGEATTPRAIPTNGSGGGGGGSNQVEYSVSLSTPLEAQIEEAERHLASLKKQIGEKA